MICQSPSSRGNLDSGQSLLPLKWSNPRLRLPPSRTISRVPAIDGVLDPALYGDVSRLFYMQYLASPPSAALAVVWALLSFSSLFLRQAVNNLPTVRHLDFKNGEWLDHRLAHILFVAPLPRRSLFRRFKSKKIPRRVKLDPGTTIKLSFPTRHLGLFHVLRLFRARRLSADCPYPKT
ncbi:hypothetical protein BJY04DRAFT_160012 [Aspergillus karnatakaensis]|uniref:uncharacterized protein n=1 Tax=Aspergillus karnatakaensis TaxID=1810916 RepID=UPI003CCDDE8E